MSKVFRLALSGANATGKTTLAKALAQEMGVPYIPEDLVAVVKGMNEIRASKAMGERAQQQALQNYLTVCQQWLQERARMLREHTTGFVADRWALDILVRWLFSGVAYDNDALYRRVVAHVQQVARQMDAVVVLPLMDLAPAQAHNDEGLRRNTHWSRRLHEQALLRGLMAHCVPGTKIFVPAKPLSVEQRIEMVLGALALEDGACSPPGQS